MNTPKSWNMWIRNQLEFLRKKKEEINKLVYMKVVNNNIKTRKKMNKKRKQMKLFRF